MTTPKKYRGLTVYRWLRTSLRACERRAAAYRGKTLRTAGAFAKAHSSTDGTSLDLHRADLSWLQYRVFAWSELHPGTGATRHSHDQIIARAERRFRSWQRSEAAKRRRRVSR